MTLERFDDSYLEHDHVRRRRHGERWSNEEAATLLRMAGLRRPLKEMCNLLQRPAAGVVPKLVQYGAITRIGSDLYWVSEGRLQTLAKAPLEISSETPTPTPTPTETEETMNKHANITTQTLIQGRDASNMSDGEIFNLIADLEGQVESLRAIKAKSTKLAAAIDALNADIAALVAYVDAR